MNSLCVGGRGFYGALRSASENLSSGVSRDSVGGVGICDRATVPANACRVALGIVTNNGFRGPFCGRCTGGYEIPELLGMGNFDNVLVRYNAGTSRSTNYLLIKGGGVIKNLASDGRMFGRLCGGLRSTGSEGREVAVAVR